MTNEERVMRAIRCESPDDQVVRYQEDEGRFWVELASGPSRSGRLSDPTDERTQRYRRHGFEMILMLEGISPAMCLLGVALFDDGEDCLLNDKAGLVRLYHRAGAAFEPFEVATMLLLHQAFGFPRMIVDLAMFDEFELSKPVTDVPGFTLPRLEGDELEFWSCFAGPIGGVERINLKRWRVTGLGGDLDWEQPEEVSIPANQIWR